MEAIILAGGFGTRLSHIVTDCPKPMAEVANKPFLTYILDYLAKQGIQRAIMAVGYMSNSISEYFGDSYKGMQLDYSVENSPLGTGGAIKKALEMACEDEVYIINGDTYFAVDLKQMSIKKAQCRANMVIATKHMQDFDRYGSLVIEDDKIIKFCEKKPLASGQINGGIYLIDRKLLSGYGDNKFSFESDYLEVDTANKNIYSISSNGYFIDIGVPEDYYKANQDFSIKRSNKKKDTEYEKSDFFR